mgnify:CR=1 FL=1
MAREIDERKKRKALRKLRKAAELAQPGLGPPLSEWEQDFLKEVGERIETYGSAFADPEKGALDEPMSALQAHKLREIDKKARGKRGGLKSRKPMGASKTKAFTPRSRDLNDDVDDPIQEDRSPPRPTGLHLVRASDLPPPAAPTPSAPQTPPPAFRVIKGGNDGD